MITGLPRSRTAWMANFFTFGDSFCFHEALVDGGDMTRAFSSVDTPYIGNSDSEIPFFADKDDKIYAKAKHVLIRRDKKEVVNSLQRMFRVDIAHAVDECVEALERYESVFKPLVVEFGDLNDKETMMAVWHFCLPTIPFPERRWEMLNDFKVEITKTKFDELCGRFGLCQQ